MTKLSTSRRIAAILAAAGLLFGLAAGAYAETVRDHRVRPLVRDHRTPLFCFGGPFGGTTCYPRP